MIAHTGAAVIREFTGLISELFRYLNVFFFFF